MYLAGVPAQDQVSVPVVVFAVGVTVRVTAWPVEVLAVLPLTTTMPVSATLAVAILPTTAMVTPVPMDAVLVGSVWNFSEIAVRAPEAARISSDTLARTV